MNTLITPRIKPNCPDCVSTPLEYGPDSNFLRNYSNWRLELFPEHKRTQMNRKAAGMLIAGHNLGHIISSDELLDDAIIEQFRVRKEAARLLVESVTELSNWDGKSVGFYESNGPLAGGMQEHYRLDIVPVLLDEIPGGIVLATRALTENGYRRIS